MLMTKCFQKFLLVKIGIACSIRFLTGFFFHGVQEVWTLCRIFKREVPCKKFPSEDLRKYFSSKQSFIDSSSNTSFSTSDVHGHRYESFGVSADNMIERKAVNDNFYESNQLFASQLRFTNQAPFMASYLSLSNQNGDELFRDGNWDELMPMVEFALKPSMLYSFG